MATIIIGLLALCAFIGAGYYTYKSSKNEDSCSTCSGCSGKSCCKK